MMNFVSNTTEGMTMTVLLVTLLFTGAAALAVGAIGASVSYYGRAALALPQQLRDCSEVQEVRVTNRRIEPYRATAKIYRPDFKRKLREQPPLRAAA
jgi:hypothetical protein